MAASNKKRGFENKHIIYLSLWQSALKQVKHMSLKQEKDWHTW